MDVNNAFNLLKDKGYKHTGKRDIMVRLLIEEKRYMSAKDVSKAYPTLSFDTIYRNFSLFERLGIVESTEFNGERHYRSSCSSAAQHHHHMICKGCRKTITVELCPMSTLLGEHHGFTITGHKFEIYGYCQDCA